MKILDILNEERLLLESGVRIPKGKKSALILHHDDMDGIMSAAAMGMQLKKQGVVNVRTSTLHDSDTEEQQIAELKKKRDNQILVVVDFDRFIGKAKTVAKKMVDALSDHHQPSEPDEKNSDKKSVQPGYGSDVLHISSTKAKGFMTSGNLKAFTGIDSAKFKGNLATNITLQAELKKKDSSEDKELRLAIITNVLLNQLVRGSSQKGEDGEYKSTVSPGATKSIINVMMKNPTVVKLYSTVKKHIKVQGKMADLLNAYEGKPSGEVDWEAIEEYNKTAPKQMRIGKDRMGQVKKSDKTGRLKSSTAEEIAAKNQETVDKNLSDNGKGGKKITLSKEQSFGPIWGKAEELAKEKHEAIRKGEIQAPKDYLGARLFWEAPWMPKGKKFGGKVLSPARKKELTSASIGDAKKKFPNLVKKSKNVSHQDGGSDRYTSFVDPDVVVNIRSFYQFFQAGMKPGFYDSLEKIAKSEKYKTAFKTKEIDMISIGKKAMKQARKELFANDVLKNKYGFNNPKPVQEVLFKSFDSAFEKSGGHKALTNVSLQDIFAATHDKYKKGSEKAKDIANKSSGAKKLKAERIQRDLFGKSKLYQKLLMDFKKRTENLIAIDAQKEVDRIRGEFGKTLEKTGVAPKQPSLKDDIKKKSGDVKKTVSPERQKYMDKLKGQTIDPDATDDDLRDAVSALNMAKKGGTRGMNSSQYRSLAKRLLSGDAARMRNKVGKK